MSSDLQSPDEFDFDIPSGQIAVRPRPHAQHRLMKVDRRSGHVSHHDFAEIGTVLPSGSLLVINNSQVVKAALRRRDKVSRLVQVLNPLEPDLARVAVTTPSDRDFAIDGGYFKLADVKDSVALGRIIPDDARIVSLPDFLDQHGTIPIPVYVESERFKGAEDLDESAYAVCYAHVPGSLACPTAGLHFYPELMTALERAGHQFVEITLHIGYGSWGSLQSGSIAGYDLNAEEIHVEVDALNAIWQAKRDQRPVIAVGTTCVRTLESITHEILNTKPPKNAVHRTTALFIHPPYQPRVADALLTDFAYPKTPIMMMSAAFTDMSILRKSYDDAITRGYMFDIFGDALLLT